MPSNRSDRVLLKDLVFWVRIGVTDAERAVPQEIEMDLDLWVDASGAASSDQIQDTVDYIEVANRVGELVSSDAPCLVEALAARIAERLLEDRRVGKVRVELRKRAASLPGRHARAGIAIERP